MNHEHNLAKVGVEGSNPFARSNFPNHRRCPEAAVSVGLRRLLPPDPRRG